MTNLTNKIINNFEPTFLYIKQHTITGMNYFGKTARQHPLKYNGSGSYWKNHIKKYGKQYITTLWYDLFDDPNEIYLFSIDFSEKMNIVESKYWANQIIETGLDNNLGTSMPESAKENLSKQRTGKGVYKDIITGEKISTNTNDPRVLSGELVGHTKGYTNVIINDTIQNVSCEFAKINRLPGNRAGQSTFKDINNNTYGLSKNDPRVLSGELVGVATGNKFDSKNKGIHTYLDINQVQIRTSTSDPRVLSGELVGMQKGKTLFKDSSGVIFSVAVDDIRVKSGELVGIGKGMGIYKNRAGNKIRLSKNDPRVLSGEYVGVKSKKF